MDGKDVKLVIHMEDKEMSILSEPPPKDSKPTLDENLVREVLFSERKKQVIRETPKKMFSPEMQKTKNVLKRLIMEAWNELE